MHHVNLAVCLLINRFRLSTIAGVVYFVVATVVTVACSASLSIEDILEQSTARGSGETVMCGGCVLRKLRLEI
jgi:hypothetical protein